MRASDKDILYDLQVGNTYEGVVVGIRYAREKDDVFQIIIQTHPNPNQKVYFLNSPWIIPAINTCRMSFIMNLFALTDLNTFEKDIVGKSCVFAITDKYKYRSLDFESLASNPNKVAVLPSKLAGRLCAYRAFPSAAPVSRLYLHPLVTMGS
jgi:hypothetical protein